MQIRPPQKTSQGSDYGHRNATKVTSFQTRTGIAADGMVGAEAEAQLPAELSKKRRTDGH
jgi:peptidoglycan hydrolase-like protein with peptidoglycan-binding domain